MTLLLIVLLPFLATVLPGLAIGRGRTACAWATAAPAIVALTLLLSQAPAVFNGEVITASWDWLPALGLNLSLMLDGYGFLFALLILGIGLLIILYARYYLSEEDPMGSFYAMLLAFMGAMLGIVLSNNILLLVVFWELTSLSSFLLIGYWRHRADARQGARMALTITGAGGLALLGGALLLGHIVGSYELTEILSQGEMIQAHPLYAPTLILILLGAFPKSAQVPFHFWLPHAMAAPTPVSAYLHSATMVKAGVFLLGRMWPALAGTDLWFFLVSGVGVITLVFAAYNALFKDDLKGLLAYSTISHLGLITMLFGLGTPLGAVAGVFHIINHATFKASLFMAAGIIDHETGTRDLRLLGGLRHYMPITMVLAVVAASAMAGVPLLNGFLSKEMFFTEVVMEADRFGAAGWLLPALATLGGVLSVAYSIRFAYGVFFGKLTGELPKKPHEPPRYMRVPVEILVGLCIIVGVVPALTVGGLLAVAAGGVLLGELPEYHLAIWHGFNVPLLMSFIALVAGAIAYLKRESLQQLHHAVFPDFTGKGVFDQVIALLLKAAGYVTDFMDNSSLQRNVAWVFTAVIVVGFAGVLTGGYSLGSLPETPADPVVWLFWGLMLTAVIATVAFHRNRLFALISVGVIGLLVALAFLYISAPDLALTQLSVEVVTTVLMLLALNLLPRETPRESTGGRRVRDTLLAVGGGTGIAAVTYAVITRPLESISSYHLAQSVPGGGGHNVVNVILVDFRGFDTFGEITVLGIAAVGVFALLAGLGSKIKTGLEDEHRHPLMLLTGTRLILPAALMVSVFIFLRGHNLPGGGFIAGLVTSVALVMQYMASGTHWAEKRLLRNYFPLVGTGLLIAGATGVASWLFGAPFLTSAFTHVHWPIVGDFEVASAVAFDIGVYLTVIGTVVLILSRLGVQRTETLELPGDVQQESIQAVDQKPTEALRHSAASVQHS